MASEQQHNQDFKRIYRRKYEFSDSSAFYQNALHLTRVHWATNNTRMSPGFQCSDKFCSDLLIKRCAGDVIDFHNYVIYFLAVSLP